MDVPEQAETHRGSYGDHDAAVQRLMVSKNAGRRSSFPRRLTACFPTCPCTSECHSGRCWVRASATVHDAAAVDEDTGHGEADEKARRKRDLRGKKGQLSEQISLRIERGYGQNRLTGPCWDRSGRQGRHPRATSV